MNKNRVDSIDGANDVYVGDYGRSDCKDKSYKFIGIGTKIVLFMIWAMPFLINLVYALKGEFFSGDSSVPIPMHWIVPIMLGFAVFLMFVAYIILPLISNRFKVRFYPKQGVLYAGNKKYLFDDMIDIGWERGTLKMTPKDGSKKVTLSLPGDATQYIGQCIHRVWESNS